MMQVPAPLRKWTAFATERMAPRLAFITDPPQWLEIATWTVVLGTAVVARAWLWHLLPVYVWSEDAASYAETALGWLNGQGWVSSPKRGPVYSLFIALILKAGGSFWTVAAVQHVLGVAGLGFACAVARRCAGPASWLPVLVCGTAYAMHGLPVYFEHVIRNEALLNAIMMLWLGCWALGLHGGSRAWLAAAGMAAGLLQLTKGMFPLAAPLTIASVFWPGFLPPRKRLAAAALCCAGVALPFLADRIQQATGPEARQRFSQMGTLLYGRVAQWTVLDGGIEPGIKAAIRPRVEAYLKLKKLDNNWVLKEGPVPVIRNSFKVMPDRERQVEKMCRRLAFEAIAAHPGEFLRQAAADAATLHLESGRSANWVKPNTLLEAAEDIEKDTAESWTSPPRARRAMEPERAAAMLKASADKRRFEKFNDWVYHSWMFRKLPPVLVASLLLSVLPLLARGWARPFAIGLALVWWSSIVILCTVGRPMDRYIVPLEPMMLAGMIGGMLAIGEFLRIRRDSEGPSSAGGKNL